MQLSVIQAILEKRDAFTVMATGEGKSLLFQLPAIIQEGVTIVFSPLVALMEDQLDFFQSKQVHSGQCRNKGKHYIAAWYFQIAAGALRSSKEPNNNQEIYDDLKSPHPKIRLLYLTPEKLQSSAFTRELIRSLYIRGLVENFVLDEGHCLVMWGTSFRESYLELKKLREEHSSVPWLVFTATARPAVTQSIVEMLGMEHVA